MTAIDINAITDEQKAKIAADFAAAEKAKKENAIVFMAHSIGDVKNHESSYIAGVCSPKRRVALELIDEFVEDFKKNAPIWKYDILNNQRIYAKDRSQKIDGAGILS